MLISRYLFRGDADVERCVVDLKLNKPKMNQFLKIKLNQNSKFSGSLLWFAGLPVQKRLTD